jgi:hypothetical protein
MSSVSASGLVITNVTTPLHIFDGQIQRIYNPTARGDWYVDTRGTGASAVPALDALNERVGRRIFADVNRRSAAHVMS